MIRLWSGRVPQSCAAQYRSEPWRCYFGYRIYATLRAPLFIFQWLYDEAQMHVDGVSFSHSQQQYNYIHSLGQQLRSTLENATAVFAPSCVSHIVLTKPDWHSVTINRISLPQAIRCWELHSYEPNKHEFNTSNDTVLNDSPNLYRKKKKRRKHMRRRHKTKRDQILIDSLNTNNNNHQNHNHHRSQTNANRFHHERHRWLAHEDLCHHWLVDDCNWPQCNRACPKLHKNYMD